MYDTCNLSSWFVPTTLRLYCSVTNVRLDGKKILLSDSFICLKTGLLRCHNSEFIRDTEREKREREREKESEGAQRVRRPSSLCRESHGWISAMTWVRACVRETYSSSGHRKMSWRTLLYRDPAVHPRSRTHPKRISHQGNPFVPITSAEAFDLRDERRDATNFVRAVDDSGDDDGIEC